jgi:hypothetical protein
MFLKYNISQDNIDNILKVFRQLYENNVLPFNDVFKKENIDEIKIIPNRIEAEITNYGPYEHFREISVVIAEDGMFVKGQWNQKNNNVYFHKGTSIIKELEYFFSKNQIKYEKIGNTTPPSLIVSAAYFDITNKEEWEKSHNTNDLDEVKIINPEKDIRDYTKIKVLYDKLPSKWNKKLNTNFHPKRKTWKYSANVTFQIKNDNYRIEGSTANKYQLIINETGDFDSNDYDIEDIYDFKDLTELIQILKNIYKKEDKI